MPCEITQNIQQLKVRVHADDLGASRNITAAQISLLKSGELDSASILTNCVDFRHLRKLVNTESSSKPIYLYVHLNLIEGKRLSPQPLKSYISDRYGNLNLSFFKIVTRLLLFSSKYKKNLISEIEQEWRFQVEKLYSEIRGGLKVEICGVDSHMHIHLIPRIFQIANSLAKKRDGIKVRIPDENIYFSSALDSIRPSWYLGLIKNLVIKLCLRLNKLNDDSELFVGIMYSGRMTKDLAWKGIKSFMRNKAISSPSIRNITVLFHPGRAGIDEVQNFTNSKTKNWYLHKYRDLEFNEVKKFRSSLK